MGDKDEAKPGTDGGDAPAEPKEETGAAPVEAPAAEKEPSTEAKSTELIDKAEAAAERMERANTKRESLLVREEALKVTETLGGKAEAGQGNKEETPEEYSKRIMAGEEDGSKEKTN